MQFQVKGEGGSFNRTHLFTDHKGFNKIVFSSRRIDTYKYAVNHWQLVVSLKSGNEDAPKLENVSRVEGGKYVFWVYEVWPSYYLEKYYKYKFCVLIFSVSNSLDSNENIFSETV